MDPQTPRDRFFDAALIDADDDIKNQAHDANSYMVPRSPLTKPRSFSDSDPSASARLSPSPHIVQTRRAQDDSSLKDTSVSSPSTTLASAPSTPRRDDLARRGLNLQFPHTRDFSPARTAGSPFSGGRAGPLSPKLDHSQVFASPANILPRRSRGLDFSRAATHLHHSTLADQSSPDSSPTIGGQGVNIPGRRSGDFSGTEQSSNSLWSVMGTQEKMCLSGSLGSVPGIVPSDSSSSSDDDLMDEDMDEAYVTTPQAKPTSSLSSQPAPWSLSGSPAASSLMSFQQRQRPKKQAKRRLGGSFGLGLGGVPSAGITKSPPTGPGDGAHARRDNAGLANQMHLSGSEGEDGKSADGVMTPSRDGQRSVIRRVVTRRGNLLPKTKGFARIRAALAEESAPIEADICREADVLKQVIESDAPPRRESTASTTQSSPAMNPQEPPDDVDDVMNEPGLGISAGFRSVRGGRRAPWDTSDSSSYTTPPPPQFRGSGSSSVSEDVCMDSPQGALPAHGRTGASSGSDGPSQGPSAAEVSRRVNTKRRRDDDLDPVALKRRAVSPSVSNSPVMQSPMQREAGPWSGRPGSNGGEKGEHSSSGHGTPGRGGKRVGFQGMVDTSDGMMRMSIE